VVQLAAPTLYTVTGAAHIVRHRWLCWSSRGSDTGVSYQLYNGIPTAGLPVAVRALPSVLACMLVMAFVP